MKAFSVHFKATEQMEKLLSKEGLLIRFTVKRNKDFSRSLVILLSLRFDIRTFPILVFIHNKITY